MEKGLIVIGDKEHVVDVPEYIMLLFNLTEYTALDDELEDSMETPWFLAYYYCEDFFIDIAKKIFKIDSDDYMAAFVVLSEEDVKRGIKIKFDLSSF